jgi:hypothetical protein
MSDGRHSMRLTMYSSAQALLKKLHDEDKDHPIDLEEHLIEPTFGKQSRTTFRELSLKYYLAGNDAIYRVINRSMEEEYIASFRSACYLYQLCIELKLKHILNEHIYHNHTHDFRQMLMGLEALWESLQKQMQNETFNYQMSEYEQHFTSSFMNKLDRIRDELERAKTPEYYKRWKGYEGNIFREANVVKNHMEQIWHFLNH